MKIISHRGNIERIIPERENTISYIDEAIALGYDVEIDIWKIGENLFLGHDAAETKINLNWLEKRKKNLWIHTKNIDAYEYFIKIDNDFIFFYHSKEDFTMTSNFLIWAHDYNKISNHSICVVPLLNERQLKENKKHINKWYAVCTDFVKYCEEIAVPEI